MCQVVFRLSTFGEVISVKTIFPNPFGRGNLNYGLIHGSWKQQNGYNLTIIKEGWIDN